MSMNVMTVSVWDMQMKQAVIFGTSGSRLYACKRKYLRYERWKQETDQMWMSECYNKRMCLRLCEMCVCVYDETSTRSPTV